MQYDVITIGSSTRDAFLVSKQIKLFPSEKFVTGVGECVALGTKIDLDNLVLSTGGGATNAAATLGSLKLKTAIISRIGADSAGADVLHDLTAHHVDTSLMQVIKGGATAYSTLLTEAKGGERTVLVYRGISADFSESDIPWNKLKTKWIYLTSLGNPALVKKIITYASKHNINIAWNPGQAEIKAGLKTWKALLPSIQLLILNREEMVELTGKTETEAIFEALHADGTVRILTDGPNGAFVYRDGWMIRSMPGKTKSISRAGAGDAFGSAFLAGLIKTDDLRHALALGILNAESVIQHYGAKTGILKQWPSATVLKKIITKEL